jgi:hypothetical protein
MTLIVTEDFMQAATAVATSSSAEASMPASRLRELQVSRRWRTTTIGDTPYIEANLEGNPTGSIKLGYNLVAVIGYDGAPSRNMLGNSLNPTTSAPWVGTNLNVGVALVPSPDGFPFAVFNLASAGGVTHLEQVLQKPGKGSAVIGSAALSLSTMALVRQNDDVDDIDLRIIAYSSLGAQEAQADFDLSAGTASVGSVSGSFTLDEPPDMIDLGDGYFLCRLRYTTDAADSLTLRYQLLDGGSTTIGAGDSIFGLAPVTMLQSVDQGEVEYPLTLHTGSGPMFQTRLYFGAIASGEVVTARSGWKHAATKNALRGFDRFSFFHLYDDLRSEQRVRVELWDPTNANGYLEAGRLIVGRAIALKGTILSQGLEESGGQIEADGGQIYRGQHRIRRVLPLRLRYLDRATAYDELHFLRRTAGRSRQVLVIAEENETRYLQEGMVYGYMQDLPPLPIAGSGGSYTVPFNIVETP